MRWKVGGRLEHKETARDNVPCTLQLALDMIQILHSSGPEELWYNSVSTNHKFSMLVLARDICCQKAVQTEHVKAEVITFFL
jgi:hypothetical protein